MPSKFEDILKAQGFSAEEIAAHASIDPKVRAAIEASYGTVEEALSSYKAENDKWAEYNETHVKPTVALYEKEKADAVGLAASLEARLKLAEQNGYAPPRETPDQEKPPSGGSFENFDPRKHNLVTHEDVARFADAEGQAIAMAADLNEEYRHLTGGKSLFEYTSQTQDGRTLRGMTALRQEALSAKKHLNQYVADKFDFAGKRAAIEAEQRKKAEEAIRTDERAKIMGQYGDPNQRPLMPSMSPFVPKAAEGGKMPWDQGAQDRTKSRIQRAMQIQATGGVN